MEHKYAPAGMDLDKAEEAASLLQTRLSSLIDLSLILKHVHWNVVGEGFMSMHQLMDEQSEGIRQLVDEIAERISTLGGVAAGLAGQVESMRDSEQDYALGRAPVVAHLGALDKVYSELGAGHRSAIDKAGKLDPITEDLLVGQSAKLELYHWFVRAHLENVDGELATDESESQIEAAEDAVYAAEPGEEVVDG